MLSRRQVDKFIPESLTERDVMLEHLATAETLAKFLGQRVEETVLEYLKAKLTGKELSARVLAPVAWPKVRKPRNGRVKIIKVCE